MLLRRNLFIFILQSFETIVLDVPGFAQFFFFFFDILHANFDSVCLLGLTSESRMLAYFFYKTIYFFYKNNHLFYKTRLIFITKTHKIF